MAFDSRPGARASRSFAHTLVIFGSMLLPALSWPSVGPFNTWFHPCPLRWNPANNFRALAYNRFRGQDYAVNTIADAINAWHDDIVNGHPRPLVLSFVGSTGVGKSLAAHTVSEAILTDSKLGTLRIRGDDADVEDWKDRLVGDLDKDHHVHQARSSIQRKLMDHMVKCGGNGVIFVDEAQLGMIEAWDAMVPAMEREMAQLHGVDFSHAVFIIASDIGMAELGDLVKEALSTPSEDNTNMLKVVGTVLREKLRSRWLGCKLAKFLSSTIPFMPLSETVMQSVISLYFHQDQRFKGSYKEVVLQYGSLAVLASPAYVSYLGENPRLAEYGARDIPKSDSGPVKRMHSAISRLPKPSMSCTGTSVCHVEPLSYLHIRPADDPRDAKAAKFGPEWVFEACRTVNHQDCVFLSKSRI